ncbi:MAG: sulfatase-like hydrolase/transferase [Acidobacteria bacterium]|nr:sulfatase-like hydrolase/transferase [Acidobacteriota bacterium]
MWRGYLGALTQVDFALGELLGHLQRAGLAENTIVVYGADHGAYSGTFGVPEKAPGICSEAVCRVPMIWRVPGHTPPGALSRQLAENIDITPTLAALCGLPALDAADGCDLSAILGGGDQPVREVAVTENVWSKALRWGPWRFVSYPREMFGADVGELYNLDDDPDETRNLYHDRASQSVVSESRRLLIDWLVQSTRHVTAWPNLKNGPPRLASDGKEPGRDGIRTRLREGSPYYL